MKRGTTVYHKFHTNVDLRGSRVYVTYKQKYRTVVEKTNKDIAINADSIEVALTQLDTLKMDVGKPIEVQIRYVTSDSEANASNIITMNIGEVLKGGVIKYE